MVKGEIIGEIWDLYDLKQQLAALDDDMELTINSPGGSVIEGLNVINLIQKCEKKIKAVTIPLAVIAVATAGLENPCPERLSKPILANQINFC